MKSKASLDDWPPPDSTSARRTNRRRRVIRFIAGLASVTVLLIVAQVHTATVGTRAAQKAIRAEVGPGYSASLDQCRAVFPGLIRCSYYVRRSRPAGPKEGGASYESYYIWDGFRCNRVHHRLTAWS